MSSTTYNDDTTAHPLGERWCLSWVYIGLPLQRWGISDGHITYVRTLQTPCIEPDINRFNKLDFQHFPRLAAEAPPSVHTSRDDSTLGVAHCCRSFEMHLYQRRSADFPVVAADLYVAATVRFVVSREDRMGFLRRYAPLCGPTRSGSTVMLSGLTACIPKRTRSASAVWKTVGAAASSMAERAVVTANWIPSFFLKVCRVVLAFC